MRNGVTIMSKIKRTLCHLPLAFWLFTFSIFHQPSSIAEIRYVSHTGSNTPPYTSWETAADSIQKCINISSFGDTIYVANGVYEEQVTMIQGLTLIGAGIDSCIVDTRAFATGDFYSIQVSDSCFIKGFCILVSNDPDIGAGLRGVGQTGLITANKVMFGNVGINLRDSDIEIYNNICLNNRTGILTSNSSSLIKKNTITLNNSGIRISSFDFSYTPIIDSNYIETVGDGIKISFGTKSTITNNTIILKQPNAIGYIIAGGADTVKISNNSVIAETGTTGFSNNLVPTFQYNNYLTGNFDDMWQEQGVINAWDNNIIKNNVITNAGRGIKKETNNNPTIQYNNSWNNKVNYLEFIPDTTNLSVDPMIVNGDSTKEELDFHLQMFSPLIDAGDPTTLDKDSSSSDIGLYGGPFGESYTYHDLAPLPPRNLNSSYDSLKIEIKWNRNSEADFGYFKLYRDTTANFIADTTTFVVSLTDTFYQHTIPPGTKAFYYKLTAVDGQGNESEVSEELAIIITSVNTGKPTIISDYRLYQNYPNPFNPSTKIGYKLKERGYVKLYVYDIKGELVSVLVNKNQEAGYYEAEFSTSGFRNQEPGIQNLASGIYIYQIIVKNESNIPTFSDIKKMIYLK